MALPSVSATPAFLGNYDQSWPNPINTWKVEGYMDTPIASSLLPIAINNPAEYISGSIGKLKYMPAVDGAYNKNRGIREIDSGDVFAMIDEYNQDKKDYLETMKNYNIAKDEYNNALKREGLRRTDAFKLMTTKMTVIPPRPCFPTQLEPYTEAWLDLNFNWGYQANLGVVSDKRAIPVENDGIRSAIGSFKQGYLRASSDTAIIPNTAAQQEYVMHTYGLLGQGPKNDPATAKGWQWATPQTGSTRSLMFSVLPYDPTDTGLTGSDEITFTAKLVEFDLKTSVLKPNQPIPAVAPDAFTLETLTNIGATAVLPSALALVGAALSLY